MKKLILLACLAVPVTAFAQGPWGDKGGCARHKGESPMTDEVTLFSGDSIEYLESGCGVTSQRDIGGGVLLLKSECRGEGTTWPEEHKIMYSADKSTVTMLNDDGGKYVLHQCR